MTDTILPEVLTDYCDATPEQRIEAMKAIGIFHDKMEFSSSQPAEVILSFTVTKKVDLSTYRRNEPIRFGQSKLMRFHNSVTVKRGTKSEVFKFFGPVKCKASEVPINPTGYQADRFLSFLSCIALDYDYLESEGILDSLDYMKAFECTPTQARKAYSELREQTEKLNNILGYSIIHKIKHIMEGY